MHCARVVENRGIVAHLMKLVIGKTCRIAQEARTAASSPFRDNGEPAQAMAVLG